MNRTQTTICAVCLLLGLALGAGLEAVYGQQAAPTENKGLTIKPLTAIDLGPEIEGMGGRQLRMRLIVIEPGGVLALHNHKDRPATDYVLRGSLVDHRGDAAREYNAGRLHFRDQGSHPLARKQGDGPGGIRRHRYFKQP